MKFEHAISLGLNCQSKYHILRTLYRRIFGSADGFSIRAARDAGFGQGSCFFDWSVTPQDALVRLLDFEFAGLFQAGNMHIRQFENGKQTVIDKAFGCAFPHDFDANQGTPLTLDDVLLALPQVYRRYDHVRANTLRLMRSPEAKLYVLYGNLLPETLPGLFRAIDRYDENYSLLVLTTASTDHDYTLDLAPRHRARLIARQMRHEPYPGHAASWERAFDDIELAVPAWPPATG